MQEHLRYKTTNQESTPPPSRRTAARRASRGCRRNSCSENGQFHVRGARGPKARARHLLAPVRRRDDPAVALVYVHVAHVPRQPGEVRERLQVLLVVAHAVAPLALQVRVGVRVEVGLDVALAVLVFYHVLEQVRHFFELVVAAVPETLVYLQEGFFSAVFLDLLIAGSLSMEKYFGDPLPSAVSNFFRVTNIEFLHRFYLFSKY